MVTTCNQLMDAFQNFLSKVLMFDDDSSTEKALQMEGIVTMKDFADLNDQTINDLSYLAEDGKVMSLKANTTNILFLGRAFLRQDGLDIDDEAVIKGITHEKFREYWSKQRQGKLGNDEPLAPAPTRAPTGTTTSISRYKLVNASKKGIKRDISSFPILKDEKFQEKWHRGMVIQANAQGLQDVLDKNYVPSTQDMMDLFEEQQKFLYTVLTTTVQTQRGKQIVKEHFDKYVPDAQKAYAEILKDHKESMKTIMLQKAVSKVDSLQSVHETMQTTESSVVASNPKNKFERNRSVLKETAAAHDMADNLGTRSRRHVIMQHEIIEYGDDDKEDAFDIGSNAPAEDYVLHVQDVKQGGGTPTGEQGKPQSNKDAFLTKDFYWKKSSLDQEKWKLMDPVSQKHPVSMLKMDVKKKSINVYMTDLQGEAEDDDEVVSLDEDDDEDVQQGEPDDEDEDVSLEEDDDEDVQQDDDDDVVDSLIKSSPSLGNI